jgi:glycosyltransferase involved in cell wall biosynthesis
MRILVDGQALQTGSAAHKPRLLMQALRDCRPGWEWCFLQAAHLPPSSIHLPVGTRHFVFEPPRPAKPFDRRVARINERYFGDWLNAKGLDAVVVLNFFDPAIAVPHFSEPRPLVVGVVENLTTFQGAESFWHQPEVRRWHCSRLRAMLAADALVVSSPATERDLRHLVPQLSAKVLVAENFAESVCEAVALRRPVVPKPAKRIAWVSPVPAAPSGIADYTADLLPALARMYDIDLVVDPRQQAVEPALAARHRTLTAEQAAECHYARPYDLFVYQLGNSGHHAYMLDLMRKFRGLVVLHDYFLTGLIAACRSRGILPAALGDDSERADDNDLGDWHRLGHFDDAALRLLTSQNRRLLSLADAIGVHSTWSWGRVSRLVDVPVARIPMPMPMPFAGEAKEALRRRLGLPPRAFVIASLGHTGHVKRLPSLLRAVALLPSSIRVACQVVFVGAIDANDRAELFRLATDLGLVGQVSSTGRVSGDDFTAYIRAADVCVQLRYPTFGETSASVLRVLAAGTPCITSDQGPMAELPDHLVPKVRAPQHEIADLAALLASLWTNPELRAALSQGAQRFVADQHSAELAAATYSTVMEQTIARRLVRDANWQELTAAVLLDGPLAAGPDRDRLLADWADLRDRCRTAEWVAGMTAAKYHKAG